MDVIVPTASGHEALQRRLTTTAWVLVAVCLVAGAIGLVWRFVGGHAAADYGSYVPWGLWIAAYIALIGASAGAFAAAALIFTQRMRAHYPLAILAMLVALGTFAAGMANVWLDLGHPLRAYEMMIATSWSSVMGWMAWLYLIYGVVLVVGLVLVRHGRVPSVMERCSWIAFVFAVTFAGAEGALFGVVGARPLWESGLTPILFLVEAALFGLALVVLAAVMFGVIDTRVAQRLSIVLLVLLAALVLLEWSEFSTGLTASVPGKEAALRTILTGDFWWVFWIVHLGLGVLLPAGLLLFARHKMAMVALASALIGGLGIASKLNLVLPALAQEELEGLSDAFHGPGLSYDYFPTLMEWLVWLGTLGLAGAIVLAGRSLLGGALGRRVPVPPDDEPAAVPTGAESLQEAM